ncbi:uncharacterized protein LOC136032859 [Artemia franciscana]|uniref:uncharacterized protein LOC136032859 n=1 Tax=Artemia franciscana TaxID=6661 RepID=UPI0032DA0673
MIGNEQFLISDEISRNFIEIVDETSTLPPPTTATPTTEAIPEWWYGPTTEPSTTETIRTTTFPPPTTATRTTEHYCDFIWRSGYCNYDGCPCDEPTTYTPPENTPLYNKYEEVYRFVIILKEVLEAES